MSRRIEIGFSPAHSQAYKNEEFREERIKRLEQLTGECWMGEFDENGRFVIYLTENDGKNNQEKRTSSD